MENEPPNADLSNRRKSRGLRFALVGFVTWFCAAAVEVVVLVRIARSNQPQPGDDILLVPVVLLVFGWSAVFISVATRILFNISSVERRRLFLPETIWLVIALVSMLMIPMMLAVYPPAG